MKNWSRAFQSARVLVKRPPIIAIELTNRCNAKCTMCWRDEVKRKHEDLDFEDFQKMVLKAGEAGNRVFQLSFFGESTLYEKLPEAVAFIKAEY